MRPVLTQAALTIETIAASAQFRHLSSIEGIGVDLRYATKDNFTGLDLYSPLDCAWLRREAAHALEMSVAWLAERRPGCTLLVLDALRPQRVQEQLWDRLGANALQRYLADPVQGSMHSFGMAVDVTIVDAAGRELDMGTGFDDLSERSHPALEAQMLARGELGADQLDNRRLLRSVMGHARWAGIDSEWWHFDFGDKNLVRQTYARVL